jgi:hypothetical protein
LNAPAIQAKPLKVKRCRYCKKEFQPARPLQSVCDWTCGHALILKRKADADAKAAKAERQQIKVRKDAIKRPSELAKEAEYYVNRYVRLRDYHKGCCSCDKPATWDGQWHCSHYVAVGASSALRFHLWNLNKACSECNHRKGGNVREYGLRMDQAKKEFLDSHPRGRRFTREYLIRLKSIFAKRCRTLEKRLKARTE